MPKQIKEDKEIKPLPRCKNCLTRLTTLEIDGKTRLWCFNCEAQLLNK